MMILESLNISKDSIKKVIEDVSKLSGKYDKSIDNISYWSDDDKDGAIFIQYKDGYATLTTEFVKNSDIDEVVEDVYYQLDNTIDEWYDNKTSYHSMFL